MSACSLIGRHIAKVGRRGIWCVIRAISVTVRAVIGFAFGLALELVFFLALFSKLFLALFISVIGSCHCMLS